MASSLSRENGVKPLASRRAIRMASILEPSKPAESTNANESILKVGSDPGKVCGVIKPHDRVVVRQKVGDASMVKIIELED